MLRWIQWAALALTLLIALPLLAGVGVAAVGYAVGTVTVEVDAVEDHHFTVPLPAGLIPVALRLVPREISGGLCREAEAELGPQWPAIHAAVGGMSDVPDGLLVDVVEGEKQVSLLKEGGDLVVRIRSGGDAIRVSAPLDVVAFAADQIEEVCEG